jgi:hypothetical protein
MKLHHYDIRSCIHDWISSFFIGRTHCVVLNGQSSSSLSTTASSRVHQETVLRPLLFLIFINDLPSSVSFTTRHFVDDCLMYRRIKTPENQPKLQSNLNQPQDCEDWWLMQFNPDKCEILRITYRKSPTVVEYKIHGQALNTVDSAKYLGLTVHKNLSWDTQFN